MGVVVVAVVVFIIYLFIPFLFCFSHPTGVSRGSLTEEKVVAVVSTTATTQLASCFSIAKLMPKVTYKERLQLQDTNTYKQYNIKIIKPIRDQETILKSMLKFSFYNPP